MTVKLTYNLDETAEALGISRRYVERLIQTGELPSVKLGRRRLITLHDLELLLDRRRVGGSLLSAKRRTTEE